MSIFSIQLDVRWGDLDAFNHVSNVAFLRYLEECRARWMDSVPSHWRGPSSGPVVASITVNYRQAIVWPAMITVTLKPQSPGRSSIKLEHEIRAANGTSEAKAGDLYADASTTLVWVDRKSGDSIPLPQAIRDLAAAS